MERSFLSVKFIDENIDYDGSQLSPHWIYKKTGIMGDAIVSFIGACDVSDEEIADIEDIIGDKTIKSAKMLHFIVELFGKDCFLAATLQSVFMSEIQNALLEKDIPVVKKGDDLYVGKGKLSISIASVSTVSALMHIGINISSIDTPVETSALEGFNVEPRDFAAAVLKRLNFEYSRITLATSKVKPRF